MSARLSETEAARLLADAEVVLVELEGCLLGPEGPAPGAAELLHLAGERLHVLSNNATHTAEELAGELDTMGLPVASQRLLLAGAAAVAHIAPRWPAGRVLPLATRSLCRLACALGLEIEARAPDAVLAACDLDLTHERLAQALAALEEGAALIAADADPWAWAGAGAGRKRPGTGALLAALSACVPEAEAVVMGLPEPTLIRHALARAGETEGRAVLVAQPGLARSRAARALGIPHLPVQPARLLVAAPQPALALPGLLAPRAA
ncbi:MAG: hypothetical protein IT557_13620 [Alphaproteobacteria bacterium]|nr:hypothetical protein [Alphaproteobacteria bacterium]